MTRQQMIIANARKNNQVFEIQNKYGLVRFFIDKTNDLAFVSGIEDRIMSVAEARQEFATLKVGCTVWQGETSSYYGGANRVKIA